MFAAAMRPSITRRDLESRIDRLIEELAARRANLGVTSGRQAIEEAAEPLETRGIIVLERGRFRVRDRSVLRYYARTIEHLLVTTGRTASDARQRFESSSFISSHKARTLKKLATRFAMRRPSSFVHRFVPGETVEDAIRAARVLEAHGLTETFDYLGESVTTLAEAAAATRDYLDVVGRDHARPASSATSR